MATKYPYTFYLLILFTCILFTPSCTYDYFEDESNYVVYVPKADEGFRTDDYTIEDLSILIYNEGLEREKYYNNPFLDNARTKVGNFNFKLFPGEYSTYCFTNVKEVDFLDLQSHNTARFSLKQSTDGYYQEPSAIYAEYKNPNIRFPGPLVQDTVLFESKYVGTICIAFKKMDQFDSALTLANIKRVEIIAGGVGIIQNLAQLTTLEETRSSRNSEADKMFLTSEPYANPYENFDFGLHNFYFPSPKLEDDNTTEPINLKLKFIGHAENLIYELPIELLNRSTNKPIILHSNETIVVKVDGNDVQILTIGNLEEWNHNIETGGNNTPNGGGTEV